ncbi:universal stress protein [Dyella halodurans]|uniref:Universal stress protein n=1 Tax=Dyella halodurans TaxID=1920171 RepID=A0ABV9C6F8_9GAMM|nr:universal stress protein [Dyella halodurans]
MQIENAAVLDIILNVDGANDDSSLLRGALELARREHAFLTGLQIVAVNPSLIGVADASMLLDAEEQDALGRRTWWLDLCSKAGTVGDWEVICGPYIASLAKRAQLADFVIGRWSTRAHTVIGGAGELARVLFADRAPMLLVPDTWQETLQAQRVMIAWNGSGEAARAIKAALPLLMHAAEVHVLDGALDGLPGISPPCPPLRAWLARHGVHAHWHAFKGRHDAGRNLQAEATARQADLLVMGAWGRSRMSELLLGGATRWLLEHTRQPLFLAH